MINCDMQKNLFSYNNLKQDENVSNKHNYQNISSNSNKVDINILLNRVKVNDLKEKKKNITFMFSVFFGLCVSAYIIFS